jgi:phosphate transport system substrate-binding protein
LSAARASRRDYTASNDDQVLADAVARDQNALGYFGYTNYVASSNALKIVSIDAGAGCVAPSAATVIDNTYQPLSRPLFLYVKAASAIRLEVTAFARSFVMPESSRHMLAVGDTPLPIATLLTVMRRLDKQVAGSIFGGRGSVVGLTPDALQDEDKIKSALVR